MKRVIITGTGIFLLLLACSYQFQIEIIRARVEQSRRAPLLNSQNFMESLADGYFRDVELYLKRNPRVVENRVDASLAMGEIYYYRGNFPQAVGILEKLLARDIAHRETVSRTHWILAKSLYFLGDFGAAATHADLARKTGLALDAGFIRFLNEGISLNLYRFSGDNADIPMRLRDHLLPFVDVEIDGVETEAALDTGASMTIISESLAEKLGIEIREDLQSWGYGLHQKKFDLHFCFLRELTIGELTVRDVPAMIFRDKNLSFQTVKGPLKIQAALGFHLLRHGSLVLDYRNKNMSWNLNPDAVHDEHQNIFVAGLRPVSMGNLQGVDGYHYIVDTGSERTFLTTQGVNRSTVQERTNFFKMIFHGFGKARFVHLKGGDAYIGVSDYIAHFRDIPIHRENASIIDGYVGNDFLRNFIVSLDFPRMKLDLAPYPPPQKMEEPSQDDPRLGQRGTLTR